MFSQAKKKKQMLKTLSMVMEEAAKEIHKKIQEKEWLPETINMKEHQDYFDMLEKDYWKKHLEKEWDN